MKRRFAAVLAAGALLLAGLSMGNAASLNVGAGVLTSATAQACTAATITVVRTEPVYFTIFGFPIFQTGWHGVRLTNVPAGCWNLPIQITAGAGPARATLPGGATSSTLTLTLDDDYATGLTSFPLVINGWHVKTGL